MTLPQGNTLQDTVNQINGNSTLGGKVYASIGPSGQLVLASEHGGRLTFASDQFPPTPPDTPTAASARRRA